MHLGKPLLAGLLATLVWTASAHAQSPDPAKVKARAAVAEAGKAFEDGRYAQAAKAYLKAYDILKAAGHGTRPRLLYNAGLAFEELSDCDRAADLYVRYLAEAPDGATADLKAQIAAVEACAPKAAISSSPSGAQVLVDGEPRGLTPFTLHLKPGNYTLTIEKPGYHPVRQAIAHQPARPLVFNTELAPTKDAGLLALDLSYAAEIFLDDEHIATGPYRGVRSMSVGQHHLRLEIPGCEPQRLTIDVPKGNKPLQLSPAKRCAPLAEDPPSLVVGAPTPVAPTVGPSFGVWSSGGASLVALLAGGTFSVLHLRAADLRDRLNADENQTASAPIRAADDAAGRWGIAASVSFGVAAIGLGSALALWLTDEPGQETALSATANGLLVRF